MTKITNYSPLMTIDLILRHIVTINGGDVGNKCYMYLMLNIKYITPCD